MRWSYWFMRLLAHWVFILYGRGRVWGLANVPRRGPVLLACNHQSYFDPVIVGLPVTRECLFMARETLFRNRFFRALIVWLNAFPVRRATADLKAVKEALRRLKGGAVLAAFPEATRTRDGAIIPLQPGIISIARRAKCPIVPTIVEGAFEIWPRGRKYPGLARVWVEYGEPIGPLELAAMGPDEAARYLTGRLRDLHNRLRRRIGRPPFRYADADQPAEDRAQGPGRDDATPVRSVEARV
jgi:1-acyl-sn-glycerol-3-phosphate acyltransferase